MTKKKTTPKAKTSTISSRRKSLDIPLALQIMGSRFQSDGCGRIDEELAIARTHVRRLLDEDDFRSALLDTAISHVDLQQQAEADITKAIESSSDVDPSLLIGHLKYGARWDGFLLGLAIAFEVQRAFTSGGTR